MFRLMLSATCLIAWAMVVRYFFFLPRGHPHRSSKPLGADMWPFIRCLLTPFWCLVQPFVVKVVSGFRYWFRYREKRSQFLEEMNEFAMDSFSKDAEDLYSSNDSPLTTTIHLDSTSRVANDRKKSTLEAALSYYTPVMDSVMTGLHYRDLVNLRLVSRTLCSALDANSRTTWRRASCIEGIKSECWNCRIQICRVRRPWWHRCSSE